MTRGAIGFVAIENKMDSGISLGGLRSRAIEHLDIWLSYYPSMINDPMFVINETSRQAARLVQEYICLELTKEIYRRLNDGKKTPPTSTQDPEKKDQT